MKCRQARVELPGLIEFFNRFRKIFDGEVKRADDQVPFRRVELTKHICYQRLRFLSFIEAKVRISQRIGCGNVVGLRLMDSLKFYNRFLQLVELVITNPQQQARLIIIGLGGGYLGKFPLGQLKFFGFVKSDA